MQFSGHVESCGHDEIDLMYLILSVDHLEVDVIWILVEDGGLIVVIDFGVVEYKWFGVIDGGGESDGAN